jgi:SAM-dependent methyltransferase
MEGMATDIPLETRACECCGGDQLESLWRHQHIARTRNGAYRFSVNNVICAICGFIFVSPTFSQEGLSAYYADSFPAFHGQELDYDVDLRVRYIERYARNVRLAVEVGSGSQGPFQDKLREVFSKVLAVEINSSVDRDLGSSGPVSDASVDVVLHYFVIEHVPVVLPFLIECNRMLAPGGVMICEAPDIEIYPRNPIALQLYEHASHFSRGAFRCLAERAGFEVVNFCAASRPFGFAAACVKRRVNPIVPDEYRENKALFVGGMSRLEFDRSVMADAAATMLALRESGSPFLLWAANDAAMQFLRDFPQPGAVLVDSAPEKSGHWEGYQIALPVAAREQIERAHDIFIFSRNHAQEILRDIAAQNGKLFPADRVHIVEGASTGLLG